MTDFKKFNQRKSYQTIIYIGSLYAGGIKGLTCALGKMDSTQYSHLLIATVGLSEPNLPVNKEKRQKISENNYLI